MKAFIVALACFLVGCSGSPTQAESSAGGAPPGPDYATNDNGEWYNPCGRTYKVTIPLEDGSKIVKEMPVYCTIWDGDFGDPPPDYARLREAPVVDPNPEQIVVVVRPEQRK